jgi:hypothetical protein
VVEMPEHAGAGRSDVSHHGLTKMQESTLTAYQQVVEERDAVATDNFRLRREVEELQNRPPAADYVTLYGDLEVALELVAQLGKKVALLEKQMKEMVVPEQGEMGL